jgi:hypothetical protein
MDVVSLAAQTAAPTHLEHSKKDVESSNEGIPSSPQNPSEKVHLIFEKSVAEVGTKDKFRVDYLRRLSGEKVWVPTEHRSPKHQSLLIFDWDDTLMYSTFLIHGSQRGVSAVTKKHLQNIEKRAYELLNIASGLGRTVIITNAMEGWVEECVERYMPSLKDVLQKVRIISARSTQEPECGPQISQWKRRAFLKLGEEYDKKTITNLVSVGDANYEMEAVHFLGEQFCNSLVKTVKLQESPTPEELMKELDLLTPKFQKIVERGISMKIRLERRAV